LEAEEIKTNALKHGNKEDQLLLETKARNTYGNIQYAKQIMKQHRLISALIITSPWQLRKANRFAKEAKINYAMMPSHYPHNFTPFHFLGAYLYSYLNLYRNFIYAIIKK
ncbi:MAG: YdcF family protein, partial [Beduini sp.]|uniref:YdcF family protein n=1 Tax=Beduini sp. TaxID=1922300 RepID=UPI003990643E